MIHKLESTTNNGGMLSLFCQDVKPGDNVGKIKVAITVR